jgi:SAM-dependent methyltransferase
MIEEWSAGVADVNMDEALLTELGSLIRPHPWWQARARLTIELLRRNRVIPPAHILDAGCGWGVTLEYLEAAGYRVTGLDISRQALELLDNGQRRLVLADLSQPIPSHVGTFDAVLALDVIEHIDDDQGAIERLVGLTAPRGVLIVTVPALMELFSEFDAIQGHRRRYDPATLARAFHTSGTEPEQVLWWGTSMVHLLTRQRRRPLGKKEESPSAIYKRYLKLPPWPGRLALDWLLRHEVGRTLRGQSKIGSSLVAIVTRPAAPAPHVTTTG